jgi:hypothetical protein
MFSIPTITRTKGNNFLHKKNNINKSYSENFLKKGFYSKYQDTSVKVTPKREQTLSDTTKEADT